MSAARTCSLCLISTIQPSFSDYYFLHNKSICCTCRDLLLSAPIETPALPCPEAEIPLFLDKELQFEGCNQHRKAEMVWVCEETEEAGCDHCIADHPERRYTRLETCIEQQLKTLHYTEYLAKYAEMRQPSEEVAEIRKDLKMFYSGIREKPAWEIYLHLGIAASGFFSRLQLLFDAFQRKSIEDCCAMLSLRGPQEGTAKLLWTHWGQHSLYTLDVETRAMERLDLSPEFCIPLFSRTIILPDGNLFLCGGRTEANGLSLNSCWKIERFNSMKVKRLPDLLFGRSNHWVLYYRAMVYVIAGCDQNNKFTNKCERFSLELQIWEQIAGTNETRDSISAVVDGRMDCIYTAGGRVDNGVLTNSIERYEISRNLWVSLPLRLPFEAYMQGVVLLPGKETQLLVFGGLDVTGQATKRTCLVNLTTWESSEVDPMQGEGGCIVDSVQIYAGSILGALEFRFPHMGKSPAFPILLITPRYAFDNMNLHPHSDILPPHPQPRDWETGEEAQVMNASALNSSGRKPRRTFFTDGRMDFAEKKPQFGRKPLREVAGNCGRQDTSPGKETRVAHFPPNSWSGYWRQGRKTDYERENRGLG